jgi:cysteine synthase A
MAVFEHISQMIGATPMLKLGRLAEGLEAEVWVKAECMNPAGSVKDRVARQMIDTAEQEGRLQPGGAIIEPTSGSTGIGLAAIAASRGYRAVIIMPDTMSVERQMVLKAYGAELVLTPGALGMQGALDEAERLHREIPGSIIAGQFVNPANPAAHYATTGPEIWADTEGNIDMFVAGIGTGGTITGTGRYLKEKNPALQVVGVEPASSPLITEGRAGAHGIQGIGANFIPQVLDLSVVDQVIAVTDADAMAAGRAMARQEGLLVGISSGAALWAALELARDPANRGKRIVAILPDTGERYLSTEMYR